MSQAVNQSEAEEVAPFAGAWIEIDNYTTLKADIDGSLPLRERGLKCFYESHFLKHVQVAPFAGAWIEIIKNAGRA